MVLCQEYAIEKAGNLIYSKKYEVKFGINKLHKAFGHCGEEALRIKVRSYDWKLIGKLETFKGLNTFEYGYQVIPL
jgi:hypothetical protein